MTPFLDEDGNGARMYEGADVNAGDPSGNRWKYRRYQRVFLKAGVIPDVYKGNNHFVIQWIHVTERTGRKQEDQVKLWVSMWEHVTKGKCGVSNQAFLVLPSDVESVQDYLCPFVSERTHMVAHSRRGWSLAFAAWQKKQAWVIEGIQDEDDEDVDVLTPAPPIPAAAIDATIITPATAISEPRNKPPPKACPPTPEKPRREELRLQPLPDTFDVSNSGSAEAVTASNADRERKRDIAERASTRFHF
jgi:hypothetical protein